MRRNNSQYHLNLNLAKPVLSINLSELGVISVESGARNFKYEIKF